jgi:Fur family peroxide stress response transcriptional regulator
MINIRKILNNNNLKITPQRLEVLNAVSKLKNHPTAENIIELVRTNNPNIAVGTVYKTLETFVNNGIVKKMETSDGTMRYDAITEQHHHLYCKDSAKIEDYFDDELNALLQNYFKEKSIPNFKIEDIKLQLIGKFEQ